MEQKFREGQKVYLRLMNGEHARDYTTSVLHATEEDLTLVRPKELTEINGRSVRVQIRPMGETLSSTLGEMENSARPEEMRVRYLEGSEEEEQRREMLRQEDELPVRYRVLTYQEYLERKVRICPPPDSAAGAQELGFRKPNNESEDPEQLVLGYLRQISQKLDRVIELMSGREREERLEEWGVILDISGSGFRFQTNHASLQEGAYLECQVDLPGESRHSLKALAQIKRIHPVQVNRLGLSREAAVHFLVISDLDQDQIVSYVLRRQRASLKKR